MNNGNSATGSPPVNTLIDADPEIESLARDAEMPVELVRKIYARERAKLEQTARIKTYVPILTHRHIKALLRERQASP
jgi:hypothetical protein